MIRCSEGWRQCLLGRLVSHLLEFSGSVPTLFGSLAGLGRNTELTRRNVAAMDILLHIMCYMCTSGKWLTKWIWFLTDAVHNCWLATPQAVSDPYCQTPCLCQSADRLSVRSTAWADKQRPRYAAKLAVSRAESPTGLWWYLVQSAYCKRVISLSLSRGDFSQYISSLHRIFASIWFIP